MYKYFIIDEETMAKANKIANEYGFLNGMELDNGAVVFIRPGFNHTGTICVLFSKDIVCERNLEYMFKNKRSRDVGCIDAYITRYS